MPTTTTTTPHISFAPPEFFGDGISVKQMLLPNSTTPFKSTYFEILPGFTTPVDRHKVEECWIVLQGTGILELDGTQVPIQEQDVLHFDPFKGHSVTNNSTQPLLICSIYW